MKLGQAMYQQQQAETEAAAGPDAGTSSAGTEQPGQEEVVDAEFSEVDEGENKG
jgi:molecular chaperone DnaK